jgi:hypothetical protein
MLSNIAPPGGFLSLLLHVRHPHSTAGWLEHGRLEWLRPSGRWWLSGVGGFVGPTKQRKLSLIDKTLLLNALANPNE